METNRRKPLLLALAGLGLLVGVRMIMAARNRYDLHGRVAIVTGGARGLGLVIARHLAANGVKLVICARSQDQLDSAQRELSAMGAEVVAWVCDVTDKSQVVRLVDKTVAHYGKVDIVVNNAGTIQVGPMNTMTEVEYEDAMNIHFWAPLYTTLASLPYFRAQRQGRIVNISSIGGKRAVPHMLPYCASKFALVGLSEGLSNELRKDNILVFTIAPGLMRTGSPRNITVKGNHEKEYAWFKTAAALPLISEEPAHVAEKIIDALETNTTHPSISGLERFGSFMKEAAPERMDFILSRINRLLPKDKENGHLSKKGYEAESALSANKIARGADVDARLNNEGYR